MREDGHWYGEMKSNATITAEYVFLAQALGFSIEEDRDDLIKCFLSEQNTDGSWSLAYDFPGDVSVTAEAYFALCLLGLDRSHPAMASAREFTLSKGGIAKVRVFTRMFFACFGLFPWSAVPELPAELILLPAAAPNEHLSASKLGQGDSGSHAGHPTSSSHLCFAKWKIIFE